MAKLRLFRGGVMRSLARWLRAQATLSLITFSELLIGFLLMRQSYSLLLAFLITLLDALPVFGTGTALVPWAVFTLLFGFPPKAIVLLALYLCTLITRNTLEPKLLSAQAGCRRSRRFLRCTSATAHSWRGRDGALSLPPAAVRADSKRKSGSCRIKRER